MKKLFVLASLVLASCFFSGFANAQSKSRVVHYRLVQDTGYPPPAMYCTVNGVTYPVDHRRWIWAWDDPNSQWFIIGRMFWTRWGWIAVRMDGVRFPASC